ncbi:hypothetical protein [Aquabacterium sp.]|uniref:hypothetical protein n=1 Tax=Aquabacterium sp. TaxID=1872578 RepID=UPI0035C78633
MSIAETIKSTRLVGVDMNLSGAWRSLGVFDLDKGDIDAVLDGAEAIVLNQAVATTTGNVIGKLRVTNAAVDHKSVLMYWSHERSWEVARHARG